MSSGRKESARIRKSVWYVSPYRSTFRIARYISLRWGVVRWGLSPRKVKGRDEMVRVLVTVEPRMYREAIALAVQRNRPNSEVMLLSEEVMDGQVKDFAPHVLVRNDFDRAVPEELLSSVVCRMEVLYTDGISVLR